MSKANLVVVLSWHPSANSVLSAGGFVRCTEILSRIPSHVDVVLIDSEPSYYLQPLPSRLKLLTYRIPPWLLSITSVNYYLGKLLERVYVSLVLIIKVLRDFKGCTLYVPFSELPQLTFTAIACKALGGSRVVLANLNPNIYVLDRIFNTFLHRFSDLNITISKALQKKLLRQGITCSEVNPVGININMSSVHATPKKTFDGVFVGRHVPEKGIFDLLEIVSHINKTHSFSLATIGEVAPNIQLDLESKVQSLGLKDRIKFYGMLNEQEKYQIIRSSRVCLFPSHQEGWGIVPQESILCNVPVVAYNLPVYQENIAACPAVKLVTMFDTIEFSEAVLQLLTQSTTSMSKAISASKKVLQQFGWDNVAKREWYLICQD